MSPQVWAIIIFILVIAILIWLLSPTYISKSTRCIYPHVPYEVVYRHYSQNKGLFCFNPSIIAYEDGYLLAIRRSNMVGPDRLTYLMSMFSGFRSGLNMARLDANFNFISDMEVTLPCMGNKNPGDDDFSHVNIGGSSIHCEGGECKRERKCKDGSCPLVPADGRREQGHLYTLIAGKDIDKLRSGFTCQGDRCSALTPSYECKYEDPRICIHNNELYVVMVQVIPKVSIFPTIFALDNSFNIIRKINISTKSIPRPIIQKNWCPFSHGGELALHTDSYPTWRVRKVNMHSGELSIIVEKDVREFFEAKEYPHLRCSTSWVRVGDNYICALHTRAEKPILYRTVLVLMDSMTLMPIKKSRPLCLHDEHKIIQFASGLLVKGEDLYITMGIGDTSFQIVRIPDFEELLF